LRSINPGAKKLRRVNMSIIPKGVLEYFSYMIGQYHEMQRKTQRDNIYRIVEMHAKPEGGCSFTIQVIGKNLTFKSTAHEIAADDEMLEGFSRQDVRTITYFACQELTKPKYKILVQEFCQQFNKMIFSLKKHDSEKTMQKTAEEISNDKKLLKELSYEEAHLIGYTAASEKIAVERQQQYQIKESSQVKYEIVSEEYCGPFKKLIYKIKRKGSKKVEQKTVAQISNDKKVIKGLKPEDAHKVGYVAGVEHLNIYE